MVERRKGEDIKYPYIEEDIAAYYSNGVILLFNDEWLILNDEVMHKINQILLEYANDKTNRRKIKKH